MDLSVIIPTYNRARVLAETLRAFGELHSEGIEWELLIVNNRSNDSTMHVVSTHANLLPVRCLYEPSLGKNRALNRGLEAAAGKLLVLADDDIIPDHDWLKAIQAASLRWPTHRAFGGRVEPLFPPGTSRGVENAAYAPYAFAIHRPQLSEGPYLNGSSPTGPNCWIRRELFELGWRFDTTIGPEGRRRVSGSELEFFTRLSAKQIESVYVPSACVVHRIQPFQIQRSYLLKRGYASGRGFMRIFGYPRGTRRILGIPRYLYRQLAVAGLEAAACGPFQKATSFEHLMRCSQFLGCMREALVMNKR